MSLSVRVLDSAENDVFPFEIRERVVGTGSHPGYRAILTITESEFVVLTIRSGKQERVTKDDLPEMEL